jgi:hypothetical protein
MEVFVSGKIGHLHMQEIFDGPRYIVALAHLSGHFHGPSKASWSAFKWRDRPTAT